MLILDRKALLNRISKRRCRAVYVDTPAFGYVKLTKSEAKQCVNDTADKLFDQGTLPQFEAILHRFGDDDYSLFITNSNFVNA